MSTIPHRDSQATPASEVSRGRSVGMFWMVWGLPLASVLISGVMSAIAVRYADPVLPTYHNAGDDDDVAQAKHAPSTATLPAMQARNHAAHLVDAPDLKAAARQADKQPSTEPATKH